MTPLNSIIEDQLKFLSKHGEISATVLKANICTQVLPSLFSNVKDEEHPTNFSSSLFPILTRDCGAVA